MASEDSQAVQKLGTSYERLYHEGFLHNQVRIRFREVKMDKKIESSNAEKVRRRVSKLLRDYGFSRTKSTFYTRVWNDRVEFVHLHKFTFGPTFRVHIGIRFLCDSFDAVSLNGPDSDSYRYNKEYSLRFWKEAETLDRCANDILSFVKTVGFNWFDKWKDNNSLLNSTESPLKANIKEEYLKMQSGFINKEVYSKSYNLLGIESE